MSDLGIPGEGAHPQRKGFQFYEKFVQSCRNGILGVPLPPFRKTP